MTLNGQVTLTAQLDRAYGQAQMRFDSAPVRYLSWLKLNCLMIIIVRI